MLPEINRATKDNEGLVRAEAIEALVDILGKKATKQILNVYHSDKDYLVRLIALRQLRKSNNRKAINLFINLLSSHIDEFVVEACEFLAEINKIRIRKVLEDKFIKSKKYFLKLCLSYALYKHGDILKIDQIIKYLNAGKKCRLSSVRKQAAIYLDYIAENSDKETQKKILFALEKAKINETIPVVKQEIDVSIERINIMLQK